MSSSRVLKWSLLLLLLPLTLGGKLAVDSYVRTRSSTPKQQTVQELAEFLARNRYLVVSSRDVVFDMQLLQAIQGPCRLQVVLSASRGWHRDLIRSLTGPTDRTFVVFAGKIYPEQPMWLTVSDFLWSRFLMELGIKANVTPVITVIGGPACAAERLPWHELYEQR